MITHLTTLDTRPMCKAFCSSHDRSLLVILMLNIFYIWNVLFGGETFWPADTGRSQPRGDGHSAIFCENE